METIRLNAAGLRDQAHAIDLANSLNALNGVESVAVDRDLSCVTVTFDPRFGSAEAVRNAVRGSGYDGSPDGE